MKFQHIIKPGIKNIYIKVDKDGSVILTSSPFRKKEALALLEKKRKWIKSAIEKSLRYPRKDNIYADNGKVYLFGNPYTLVYAKGIREEISFNGKSVCYHSKTFANPQTAVEKFYKNEIHRYISLRISFFSKKLSLYPKEIRYRKMKRRLGSCSSSNVLTFNTLLSKLSHTEIDYVIVHELSHIKYKNHSKKFWEEVAKIFPNYKKIRSGISL